MHCQMQYACLQFQKKMYVYFWISYPKYKITFFSLMHVKLSWWNLSQVWRVVDLLLFVIRTEDSAWDSSSLLAHIWLITWRKSLESAWSGMGAVASSSNTLRAHALQFFSVLHQTQPFLQNNKWTKEIFFCFSF